MRNNGFTIIEIMISLALVGGVAVLGLFWSRDLFEIEGLEGDTKTLATILMRARNHSLSNLDGVPHGVCYDDEYHLYLSFADTPKDESAETFSLGRNVEIVGLPDCSDGGILFTQLSATTTLTQITLTKEMRSKTIEINQQGLITW